MTSVSSHDDAVVSIRNVTKMFGDVVAVDNVSALPAAARPRCCGCWPVSSGRARARS